MRNEKVFGIILGLLVLSMTSCDEAQTFEVGGRYVVGDENTHIIKGDGGVWEIPGLYKVEVLGVFIDDETDYGDELLLERKFSVVFRGKQVFDIAMRVTNINYDVTDKELEEGTIKGSSLCDMMRINDDTDETYLRPFPYDDGDEKYDIITLDYGIPAVKKGETSEILTVTMATKKPINIEKDVICFHNFWMTGEAGGITSWFELTPQKLSEL